MEIQEIRLVSTRPAALKRFYGDALGLPVGDNRDRGLAVTVGRSTLAFGRAATAIESVYHVAFAIPEDAFAPAKRWLGERARLITRDGEDEFAFPNWNARSIYVHDPAGNILELIARRTPGSVAGDTFAPAQLLAVSEVGVVVGDVVEAVSGLGRLGLPEYVGGSPEFGPVGDERGLLIVVPTGRPWFPSGEPAIAAPSEITLRGTVDGEYTPPGSSSRIVVRH